MTINERVSQDRLNAIKAYPLHALFHMSTTELESIISELQQYRAAAEPVIPDGLHPATADLVLRFATALAEKLHKAEQKYGYSDNWQRNDWYDDCLQSLWEHIEKGDPRDVAAYCAFMWFHGWATTDYDRGVQKAVGPIAAPQVTSVPVVPQLIHSTVYADYYAIGWNACRAAMLQGADGKPELTVWYGSMPESNGKTNWTAILHRKGEGIQDGFTIDRSEYPDRVRYAADRVRYLIGEIAERPYILNYDADEHSGYTAAPAVQEEPLSGNTEHVSQPTLPEGYLQGYKDGCEWSALMAEANHPQTGDWLFDDPIELAKAIRKGPDMLPVEPGKSPAIPDGWTGSDKANAALVMLDRIDTLDPVDDDRIEGIKRIIRELAAAPKQEAE